MLVEFICVHFSSKPPNIEKSYLVILCLFMNMKSRAERAFTLKLDDSLLAAAARGQPIYPANARCYRLAARRRWQGR